MRTKDIVPMLFLFILMLISFSGAYVTSIGVVSSTYIIVVIFIAYSFIKGDKVIRFNKNDITHFYYFYIYVFILFILYVYSLFMYAFFNVGNDNFIAQQLKQVQILFISTIIFSIISRKVVVGLNVKKIAVVFFYFIIFLSIFNITQIINPTFKNWVISFSAYSLSAHWSVFAIEHLRGIGLQGLSLWDTAVGYSLLLFGVAGFLNEKGNKGTVLFVFSFFLLFFLTVISGRTGLIILIVFFIIILICYKRYFLLISIVTSLILILILSYNINDEIRKTIDFGFELFINIGKGKLQTGSTNDLFDNMLFVPHMNDYIFGDNIYIGDGGADIIAGAKDSDSSFIINYKAYGILGLFFTSLLTWINYKVIINITSLASHKIKGSRIFKLITLLLVVFLYIKAPVYISALLFKVMIILYACINTHNNCDENLGS
ncbi:hypothetical protein GLP11_15660 [Photobacterium carnosum]|uniref:hypothetical protein n=1 Tax=Photobacterium carnosum TaxID=2023717 RepID=UPI001F2859F3|nr:hypothetical protein [Photobacterium carnosum]MCF2155406.1 hypothetical protein [Photobacterium carnosum]MCF2217226.1 hypothetical protein [Photobacterium carnosum]